MTKDRLLEVQAYSLENLSLGLVNGDCKSGLDWELGPEAGQTTVLVL